MIQILQELEPASLKIKRLEESQAEPQTQLLSIDTGRPATTFEFSDLLCSKNNNQCYSCRLSSFGPTEVILAGSRKIRNTQLHFVFLNFSFLCQNSLRWSKTQFVSEPINKACIKIGQPHYKIFYAKLIKWDI